MKDILKSIGGWPILEGRRWRSQRQQNVWNQAMKIKDLGYSSDYLTEIDIAIDIWNTSKYAVYIRSPHFGISREYLVKGLNSPEVQGYYK